MAYINDEKKESIKNSINEYLTKNGYKGKVKYSLTVENYSTICFTLLKGPFKLEEFKEDKNNYDDIINGSCYINEFKYNNIDEQNSPEAIKFIKNIIQCLNINNYDNSDYQTDYYDVGHYVSFNIGDIDKPYLHNKEMDLKSALENVKKLKEKNYIKEQVNNSKPPTKGIKIN